MMPRQSVSMIYFGSPSISMGPVASRPTITHGLALSASFINESDLVISNYGARRDILIKLIDFKRNYLKDGFGWETKSDIFCHGNLKMDKQNEMTASPLANDSKSCRPQAAGIHSRLSGCLKGFGKERSLTGISHIQIALFNFLQSPSRPKIPNKVCLRPWAPTCLPPIFFLTHRSLNGLSV